LTEGRFYNAAYPYSSLVLPVYAPAQIVTSAS